MYARGWKARQAGSRVSNAEAAEMLPSSVTSPQQQFLEVRHATHAGVSRVRELKCLCNLDVESLDAAWQALAPKVMTGSSGITCVQAKTGAASSFRRDNAGGSEKRPLIVPLGISSWNSAKVLQALQLLRDCGVDDSITLRQGTFKDGVFWGILRRGQEPEAVLDWDTVLQQAPQSNGRDDGGDGLSGGGGGSLVFQSRGQKRSAEQAPQQQVWSQDSFVLRQFVAYKPEATAGPTAGVAAGQGVMTLEEQLKEVTGREDAALTDTEDVLRALPVALGRHPPQAYLKWCAAGSVVTWSAPTQQTHWGMMPERHGQDGLVVKTQRNPFDTGAGSLITPSYEVLGEAASPDALTRFCEIVGLGQVPAFAVEALQRRGQSSVDDSMNEGGMGDSEAVDKNDKEQGSETGDGDDEQVDDEDDDASMTSEPALWWWECMVEVPSDVLGTLRLQLLRGGQEAQVTSILHALCWSSSTIPKYAGFSMYESPLVGLFDAVTGTVLRGAALDWGHAHEPDAREDYLLARLQVGQQFARKRCGDAGKYEFRFVVPGKLLGRGDVAWCATSFDGVMFYRYAATEPWKVRLVEIKCPYTKLVYKPGVHPYSTFTKNTSPTHAAQMIHQQAMWNACVRDDAGVQATLLDMAKLPSTDSVVWELQATDYVVWQPKRVWITEHAPQPELWWDHMMPMCRALYWQEYLPRMVAVWKHRNVAEDLQLLAQNMSEGSANAAEARGAVQAAQRQKLNEMVKAVKAKHAANDTHAITLPSGEILHVPKH